MASPEIFYFILTHQEIKITSTGIEPKKKIFQSLSVLICLDLLFILIFFCLAVSAVLARKWSPPPRTHPGGVCLR